ncbi:collagen-like protein [Luteolibacter yonseiensis]|uniref:Collagen-like protein n=1 Tax=Luteolibacter yonseiensis TaxID=1144680 RepID=A0A934R467_9BACT|nr:collagen-like protein [Luteolibacter yonseiensis]MBK1815160.1 collagen-like protein [Luteolibacter yonseiensis]
MSLHNEISTVTFDGNNSNRTGYDIPFPFFEKSHLSVIVTRESDGAEIPLILNSGFGVEQENETKPFKIVTSDPWDSTHTLTITRRMPLTQTHEYVEGQRIAMGSLEKSFDWIVMQVQWLWHHFHRLIADRPTHAELAAAIEAVELTPGPRGEQGIQGVQGPQGIQGPQGETGEPMPLLQLDAPPQDGIAGAKQTIHAAFPGTVVAGGNITVHLRYPGMPDLGPYLVAVQSGDNPGVVRTKMVNELNLHAAVTGLADIWPGGTGTLVIGRRIEAASSSAFGLLVSMGSVTGISYTETLVVPGNEESAGTVAGAGQLAIVTMPGTGNKYTFVAQGTSPMRWAGVTSGLIHDEELPGWRILRYHGSGADRTTEHVAID